MEILQWFWINFPFRELMNPNKRIYWPYLALCIIYAILYLIFCKHKQSNLYFSTWLSKSARIDYVIWILNYILQISILPLIFMNGLYFSGKINFILVELLGSCKLEIFMTSWGIFWYSLTFVIMSDFSRYYLHYLLHRNKFLAPFHRMHHSAEVLTPITLYRSHPIEMILSHIRYLFVYSIITGVFLYLFNDFFEFPTILGASFFVFFSNILGANLRHSNIPIGFGKLEKIFISPKMHQMHHSKDLELQNSNLGSFLSIWDRLFKTYKSSKNVQKIDFGIADNQDQSLLYELVYPFNAIYKILSKTLLK